MFRTPTTVAFVLSLALGANACSSARPQIQARPFTANLHRVFDDAVDYVTDVEGLGGRVASDWQNQIDALSRESDVIGTARIETVVLEQNPDGSRAYRLTAVLSDLLRGEAPEGNQVSFRVAQGTTGFNTVVGRETRLQSGRYMAFVRWYNDSSGAVRAHFHLSPLSDALVARVRRNVGWLDPNQGQERVVREYRSGSQ